MPVNWSQVTTIPTIADDDEMLIVDVSDSAIAKKTRIDELISKLEIFIPANPEIQYPNFDGTTTQLNTYASTLTAADTGKVAIERDISGRIKQRWEWDGARFLTLDRYYVKLDVQNVSNSAEVILPLERVPYVTGCFIEAYHQQVGISGANDSANYYAYQFRYRQQAYGASQTPLTTIAELTWSTQNVVNYNGVIFEYNSGIVLPVWPNRFEHRRDETGNAGASWFVVYATIRGIR